jgi:hypothetical protein
MGDLVRAYQEPELDLDPSDSDWLAEELGDRVASLERAGLIDQLKGALGVTLQGAEQARGDAKRDAEQRLLAFTGSGFARATRICDGWTTPPVPDREQNGTMEFVIGFTDDRLDRVLFGTVEDCHYLVGKERLTLTAANAERPALSVHLGNATRADDLDSQSLTFDVNLRGRVGADDLRLALDFRVRPNGDVEFRVPTQGDSLVVVTRAGIPTRIRAHNGDFACDETALCGVSDAGVSDQ